MLMKLVKIKDVHHTNGQWNLAFATLTLTCDESQDKGRPHVHTRTRLKTKRRRRFRIVENQGDEESPGWSWRFTAVRVCLHYIYKARIAVFLETHRTLFDKSWEMGK